MTTRAQVALGVPVAGGTIEYRLGISVPGHFLERKGSSEQILRKSFSGLDVLGGQSAFTGVDIKSTVFPVKQLVDLPFRYPVALM